MEGYEVHVLGDDSAGTVVGRVGDVLLVEQGTLRKKVHGLPLAYCKVDDDAQIVHATVGKDLLAHAPEAHDGEIDTKAVAEHFGLAEGYESPETGGYGVLEPDDPAWSSEVQARRSGVLTATEERLIVREHSAPGEGPLDTGEPSPGVTGGDRRKDAPGRV